MPKAWSTTKNRIAAGLHCVERLNQRGFSPIEVLLAATVFGFLVVALIGAFIYGRASTQDAGDRAAAIMLAEEGVEGLRNLRNGAYTNLTDGTFGLAQTSNLWALSGSSDTSGIYTRQLTISSNGTNRKNVTSTVSWTQGDDTKQVSVTSMLSNWMAAIKSWVNAIVGGSGNATTTTNFLKVATSGNYAFAVVSSTSSNFVVTDISNTAAPSIVRTISITGTPSNIFILGNYAFVTTNNGSGEVVAVNIATPTTAAVAATYNAPGTAAGLGIFGVGNSLYVTRASSSTDNEFLILNAATPTALTLTGSYNNNVAMNEVYVSGDYAYVAISSLLTPILVINIATPASPSLGLAYGLSLAANSLTIDGYGSHVYLGSGTTLTAINVTNPLLPTIAKQVTVAGTINDIDVDTAGQYAFLGTNSTTAEFQVASIAAPASMSVVRAVDATGTASTVSGVSYSVAKDVVVGASASDTQEILLFTKN